MILIQIFGGFLAAFGVYYLIIEKLIHRKDTRLVEAEVVDEAEADIFDNTGGTKTRFYKVFSFDDNGESAVVRSTRPMRRISDTVGEKVYIYVDVKNRLATEKRDMIKKNILSALMIIFGLFAIALTIWIKLNVEGAVL